jgi:hypothetical protein
MSNTRKVTITLTRYYSKQSSIEIEVDNNIQDDELKDYLTENNELDNQLTEALDKANLVVDEDKYEFQDPTNNFGGHL